MASPTLADDDTETPAEEPTVDNGEIEDSETAETPAEEPAETSSPDLFDGDEDTETLDEPEERDDVDIADVDPNEVMTTDNGLFDGDEDTDTDDTADSSNDPLDDLMGGGSGGPANEGVSRAVNDGIAAVATAGLEDDRDEYEDEFKHIAEQFRVGHFGERIAEEYLFVEGEEPVDPFLGFVGSIAAFGVFCLMMRPDRDEQIDRIRETAQDLAQQHA